MIGWLRRRRASRAAQIAAARWLEERNRPHGQILSVGRSRPSVWRRMLRAMRVR